MKSEDQIAYNGIILLDIGNTNLRWAWLNNGLLGGVTNVTHKEEDIKELVAREWSEIAAPSQIFVSNVAGPSLESDLADWVRQRWGFTPKFVRSTAQACGVLNSYSEPGRLGVDRWLSMIALHVQSPGTTCVVDCGTAVTIDVIGLDGRHLGGLILPGLGLMRHALMEQTSISFDVVTEPDGLLATNTESAIAAGGVNAIAALIEKIMREVGREDGGVEELVLTGGDAPILRDALNMPSRIETDLVMQGLMAIIKNRVD